MNKSINVFTGIQGLGQFGESGPQYPKSCEAAHEKKKPKSSALDFTSN